MELSSSDFLPPFPPTPNPNHATLELAGEIPVFPIGMIADAINLIEYLIEGDLTNVLWSAFAFVPTTDANGNSITYKEYDVNSPGVNGRDEERFVVGSDGNEYYTNTHYGNKGEPAFIKII